MEFRGCRFENNAGQDGGAMALFEISGTIADCTFVGNESFEGGRGGGSLSMRQCDDLTIVNSLFVGNRTTDHNSDGGGAIAVNESSPLLVGCVISGNRFQSSGEFAFGGGGVLIENGSAATLVACTITGNDTNRLGGGVHVRTSDPVLVGCILWGNTHDGPAGQAAQIHVDESSGPAVDYSCVEGLVGDLGGAGNIDLDPAFADPIGPDGVPGTEDDDLRLAAGSPCIDAGDNDAVPGEVTTDAAGFPRRVDDPGTVDTGNGVAPIIDMGAHEFQPGCPADLNGDGIVGFADVLTILAAWGDPGGDADLDASGTVDLADLLIVLAVWGPCDERSN